MRRRWIALGGALVVIVALAGTRAFSPAKASLPEGRSAGRAMSTAAFLHMVNAPMPSRNLYALTERLKLNGHTAIPHVVRRKSPNYPVGHTDTFWILDQNKDHYFKARATIVCKTAHLYLYVGEGVNADKEAVCRSANVFEHRTYLIDRKTFGSEWTPGVDDDPRITVFYGDIKFGGGYYAGEDEYPRIVDPYSNQREIAFINSSGISIGTSSFDETLAHEFQHMIHWHMHAKDEAWINEGASMLAQKINGYGADGVDQDYAGTQNVQLDAWSDSSSDLGAHYGAGFLWMDYLYERFGRAFVHAMLADRPYTSFPLVADVLRKQGLHTSVSTLFADWAVANELNNGSIADGKYGYRNTDIHAQTAATTLNLSSQITYQSRIHPYAPAYVALDHLSKKRTITFHGASTMPLIGAGARAPFWWSNRCDFCDTSMTRVLDLRHARRPSLAFNTWYDIEKDYDYGYVEVSTDHGKTWHTLPAAETTTANPNGDNFGSGFTGRSTHVHGNSGGWVPVRMGLRAYAGKRVLLRFEYITDDEYNGQSWAVRDISVAASGFTDRVGPSDGWKLAGFVPVHRDEVPDVWSLRLIAFPHGKPAVQSFSVPASGQSNLTLDPASDGSHAILVVVSQATKTTLSSSFRLAGASAAASR